MKVLLGSLLLGLALFAPFLDARPSADDSLADYRPPAAILPGLRSALDFLGNGEPSRAIAALNSILKQQEDPYARFLLGQAYLEKGEPRSAVAEYKRVAERYPRDRVVLGNLARAYVLASDPEGAHPFLIQALGQKEETDLIDLLAQNHVDNGDYAAAIELLRDRLRLAPDDRSLRTHLVRLELLRGNPQEARRLAREWLEARSFDGDLVRLLANAELTLDNPDQARVLLQMLDLHGTARAADRRMLADLHLDRYGYSEAARLYQFLLESETSEDAHRNETEDRYRLALALFHDEQFEEAKKFLAPLSDSGRDSHRVAMLMGRILAALGENELARESFALARERNPQDPQAYWLAADLCRSEGDLDGAERLYLEASVLPGGGARSWAGLGEVALARGQALRAVEMYRRATSLDPGHRGIFDRFVTLNRRYRNQRE